MGVRGFFKLFLPVSAVIVCRSFLDTKIAQFISEIFRSYPHLSRLALGIPDLLKLTVIGTAFLSAAASIFLLWRESDGIRARNFARVGISVCLAYFLGGFLKYIFGSVDPWQWSNDPVLYGFHWLRGDFGTSFPSGHMTVFTALAAALWRLFPRWRAGLVLFLSALACALIVTQWHFLSDVIAGAYVGLVVDSLTHGSCLRLAADKNTHFWECDRAL